MKKLSKRGQLLKDIKTELTEVVLPIARRLSDLPMEDQKWVRERLNKWSEENPEIQEEFESLENRIATQDLEEDPPF